MKKNKKIAIYPGTFDPVTFGHIDIMKRASEMFDELIIAVAKSSNKATLFTSSERMDLLTTVIKNEKFRCPVQIESFSGLLVRYAQKVKATTLVRGLRAISDFEYEFQMALMNRHQAPKIETVFLMPDEKYVYLSSSLVKEIARLGGDLKSFLPLPVLTRLTKKLSPV
jgi:pantetheine-phosphate adenylyltransferase